MNFHPSADAQTSHCPDPKVIRDAVAGGLDEVTSVGIFSHADECSTCQSWLRNWEAGLLAGATNHLDTQPGGHSETDFFDPAPSIDAMPQLLSIKRWMESGADSIIDPSSTLTSQDAEDLLAQAPSDRYQMLRGLGHGAMGAVYLAKDLLLNRDVALKMPIIPSEKRSEYLARFRRESRIAAKMRHPNICPVFDVGQSDDRPFIAMAYIEGETLAARLDGERLDPTHAAQLVRKIASALSTAHELGILHRDLKPANILMDPAGEPVVTDFGLATQSDQNTLLTQTGNVLGTPAYMSPEQIDGHAPKIDARTDVYSLGVIYYEMLTVVRPFAGPTLVSLFKQITTDDPVPPRQIDSTIDPEWEAICLRMIEKEPADRFASMDAVSQSIDDHLAGRFISVRQPKSIGQSQRRKPRWHLWIIAAASLAAVLLAVVVTVRTDRTTVKVRVDGDPDASVTIDIQDHDPQTPPVPAKLPVIPKPTLGSTVPGLDGIWSPRINLGANINSVNFEEHPEFSADGLTLYFSSAGQIFQARRSSTDTIFGPRTCLIELDDPNTFDSDPTVSFDEREVIFTSFRDRPGDQVRNDADLWTARREHPHLPFDPPNLLTGPINTSMFEFHAKFSADALTLWFTSDREGTRGDVDIWKATRPDRDTPFANVQNIGPSINNEVAQESVEVSSDGLLMLLTSGEVNQPAKLHSTRRTALDSPWAHAEPLGGNFDQAGLEEGPAISPDGRTIVFASDWPGGFGGFDLWMCQRVD